MTCIIGLVHEGTVWIGGDSGSVSGWNVRTTMLEKVFRVQDFLIGYTGSFRMGQILQYHLEVPPQEGVGDLRYLVTEFVPRVRACFKDHWFSTIDDKDNQGGTFLLGYRGHLYTVFDDFQINEPGDKIGACGNGQEYALGAMMALRHLPPEARIMRTLGIVAYFSPIIYTPFHILSMEG